MTDTTAPTPEPWYAVLQALTPSLNQAVVAIVGAFVGIMTTLGTQWATARPPAEPAAVVKTVETTRVVTDPTLVNRIEAFELVVGKLVGQVAATRKDYADRVAEVKALQADLAARTAARKARAAAKAAPAVPPLK